MNLKFTQNSIIGSKLQKNTVRLILAAIFVTAIPLIVLFSNSKIKNSLNQLNVIGSQATQQLDLEATNIIAYAKLIPTDKQLSALIAESNPADKVKIENKLMELSGIGANIQNIIINTSEEVYHSVFLTDEEAQVSFPLTGILPCMLVILSVSSTMIRTVRYISASGWTIFLPFLVK